MICIISGKQKNNKKLKFGKKEDFFVCIFVAHRGYQKHKLSE